MPLGAIQASRSGRAQIRELLMTLCVAWVRVRKRTEELYMIADSRFTCGDKIDGCPKLFPLERGDCAIACAGVTEYSLPIAVHLQRSIELNIKSRTRAMDFFDQIHSVVGIVNKCLQSVREAYPDENDPGPGFQMMMAGFSVKENRFVVRIIEYDKKEDKMFVHKASHLMGLPFGIIGDHGEGDANYVKRYRNALYRRLVGKQNVDMEPLEVLMDFIKDPSFNSIGGNPQMLKITKFLRVLPYGFYHGERDGHAVISYYGRNLLSYETFPFPIYDLESKEAFYMKGVLERFKRVHEEEKALEVFKKARKKKNNDNQA